MISDSLRRKFCRLFDENKLLDKNYYYNKFDNILELGKMDDFDDIVLYDLDAIGGLLYNFITEDIESLHKLDEDVFAAELLNKCDLLLTEEITMNLDGWYDCAEAFVYCADNILMDNEDNKSKVFDKLEINYDKLRSIT